MEMNYESLNDRQDINDAISDLKRKQVYEKKNFTSSFLYKLDDWLNRCFLGQKDKKDFFITKEKLIVELLMALQSQKKFKDSDMIHNQICSLAVFDVQSNLLGKIINICYKNFTVEFETLDTVRNSRIPEIRSLKEVEFFDPFSVGMQKYFSIQRTTYDCFNFHETFKLLTGKEEKIKAEPSDTVHYSLGRGMPLDRNVQNRINNSDLNDKKA